MSSGIMHAQMGMNGIKYVKTVCIADKNNSAPKYAQKEEQHDFSKENGR